MPPDDATRAAARVDLLLATVQELLGDLERDGVRAPMPLQEVPAALAQASRQLHEQADGQPGYASALVDALKEQDARSGHRLAERADAEAEHLMELLTSAAIQGRMLPWGVEETARNLKDWARRQRYRP